MITIRRERCGGPCRRTRRRGSDARHQLNRSAAPYAKVAAARQAYDACMNEKDILTAFCTQDRYISFWVEQRREPRRPPPPAQPCPGPDLVLMPDPQSTTGTLARTYRAKGSKPETVAYWAKRAAGATPASMGVDITMPQPTYALPRVGEPVNASGVPVGAKLVVSTAESIDLLHADISRLVPARLASPADYRGKSYLSPGTPISLRVQRETQRDKLVFVNFSVDSIEVNGQKHPLPVTAQDGRTIELMDAFGRLPAKPPITVLPPQTLLHFVVVPTDPATLPAVPFITEDKKLTYSHGVRANVASGNPGGTLPTSNGPGTAALQAASGSDTTAIPGNLALSLVAVEPIDLASADATRRFRAQTTAPVIHQGNILIPAGSDVFLKVMRKQETRGFLHVALAADYAIIAGSQVPLATTQMMRSVSRGTTPLGIPTRPGQLPPPGAPTLPAQTQLNLITVTPQTR
jgi:hypothetical protein